MERDLAARIALRLEKTGKSARGASLEAGLSDAFVRNILEGKSKSPRSDTIVRLAPVLGTTDAWLLREEGPEEVAGGQEAARPTSAIVPGAQLVSSLKMPVYAAAMGGDGHIIVSFEQIDEIKRPAELENVRGGYGLLIKGDSMVPALWDGDMALVNPHLRPAREFNHVFYHEPPNGGEVEAMVKQLEAFNDREWTVKQWNPVRIWKESRQVWQVCHRVVGRYDRR